MRHLAIVLVLCLALSGCSKPVPPERADYIGKWTAHQMELQIFPEGRVTYKRQERSTSHTLKGPIRKFEGDSFVVGIPMLAATFQVASPPRMVNGVWKMTVDGMELTRVD